MKIFLQQGNNAAFNDNKGINKALSSRSESRLISVDNVGITQNMEIYLKQLKKLWYFGFNII